MKERKTNNSSTLSDVAKAAQVSIATASRVLSNSAYPVSREVRQRVLKASKELSYMPNLLGRMLKSNHYRAIGVIVPTLQNPFFNQVIFGIETAARQHNYEIMIFSSHRSFEQERSNIRTLIQNRVMSLIIISIDNNPDALNRYLELGGKIALLEADFTLENAILAETDYMQAGQIAAKYLLQQGHRRIAFFTAPLSKLYRREILNGVRKELLAAQVPFSDQDIFVTKSEIESDIGQFEFENGKQLVEEFLGRQKKNTAIIVINDITAFGVIQALTQHGLLVPDDISVISFDNIIYSEMISPPLTTVEFASNSMGFAACQTLLFSVMSDEYNAPALSLKFPCRLVERQSVKNR